MIDHQSLIYVIYGLDVNSIVKGTHLRFICKNCKQKLQVDFARNHVKPYENARAQMWIEYNGDVSNDWSLERHFMTSDPSLLLARPVIRERKRRKKLFEDADSDTQ